MTGASTAVSKASVTLAPDARAAGLARRFVAEALAGTAAEITHDIAVLLVSEVVTNAVVHAASAVEVEVTVNAAEVIVGVRDADTGPLVARTGGGSELDEGGRGFLLIDRLAHSWGTEHEAGRKTVWYRLALGDPEPSNEGAAPPPPPRKAAAPVSRPRDMLHSLLLRPSIEDALTLTEQIREVLARVVDLLAANGGAVYLVGVTEPITVGADDGGTTSTGHELVVDDRRLGTLTIAHDDRLHGDDEAFVQLAADRLALLAAEHGALRSEQGRGADNDFLSEATELLAGSTSVAVSLTLLTQIVVPRLAEWCAALTVDDRGRPRRLTANHRREDRTDAVHNALEAERELREALMAAAAGQGPQRLPATVTIGGQRTYVVVLPLISHSRILGVLVLGCSAQLDPVTYMSAVELARRAALVVDNARLHEEQAATVTALQASLLPTALPTVAGLELAARYHSASPGMSVGGDFYDALVLDGNQLVLAVGDVCGKGAEAAAITGMSRDLLRMLVEDGADPGAALRRLNRALLSYPASSRFCTIALARLERRADFVVCTVCLGGHPEPVVLRADGRTELVGVPGDLLGVLGDDELELHETEVVLRRGDALVLYTDGLTERRDGRRMFGQYGLRKTLSTAAGQDAEGLASALEHAAESFVDTELRDDLAVLVMRRVG